MVFFTCNSCGESLKKNKVDKHLSQCRSKSISCVDCGKDFTYDYYTHNQCISEDQKYGGLDYKPKENSTKGRTKQEEWVQKVKKAINESNCSNHIKDLLNKLSAYDNIPRKKQKFFNFVRSCLQVNNEYYAQQMWNVFENTIKSENNSEQNSDKNETTKATKRENDSDLADIETQSMKKKHKSKEKNKAENAEQMNGNEINGSNDFDETQELDETETNSVRKPKMKKIVVQILRESQNNSLSLKKLKKKVIKKYKSMDDSLSKEDIESKFLSKLEKIKKIEINVGIVSLKTNQ